VMVIGGIRSDREELLRPEGSPLLRGRDRRPCARGAVRRRRGDALGATANS